MVGANTIETPAIQSERRLPIGYHAGHFQQVIEGVQGRYGHFLTFDERDYLRRIDSLSQPALGLFARLANRRGPCFRVDRIRYVELADVGAAVAELTDRGFLVWCVDADAGTGVLNCFAVPELRASLLEHGLPRTSTRGELLAWLGGWHGIDEWLPGFLAQNLVVRIADGDLWPFLRFLFFGEIRDNLADFVTRALGHVVPETIDPKTLIGRFTCRQEADDAYRMAVLYIEFRTIRKMMTAAEALAWWQGQAIDRATLTAGVDWFDRVVGRLGYALEREGRRDEARALYETSPIAPARERRARLLIKAGRTDEAVLLLRAVISMPCHAEEAYDARQILARLEKTSRRSEARHLQHGGELLVLDYKDGHVESAVLTHFQTAGWQGVHSENWLWCGLFGLLFWDIIYDTSTGAFHSPLQIAPADLYEPGFYCRREQAIEARLHVLMTPPVALQIIERHFQARRGIANPFVHWNGFSLELAYIMLNQLPPKGLAAALRRMATDVKNNTRGLPDLFLWKEAAYRFIEIKAENDHLAAHQYEWLRFLAANGINVAVYNVQRRPKP